MKTDDSGPAFPCHTNPRPGVLANAPQGMTLRQWYAGLAMQGWLASYGFTSIHPAALKDGGKQLADFVLCANATADAMLAADGPSRLAIECGRLCAEVLEMAKGFETASSGDVALSLAWNSLVANCLSAGAVLPPEEEAEHE